MWTLDNIGTCEALQNQPLCTLWTRWGRANHDQLGSVMWDHSCGPPVKGRQKTLCWQFILWKRVWNVWELLYHTLLLWIPPTFPCSQPEALQMLLDSNQGGHQVTWWLVFFHLLEVATDVGCTAWATASLARRAPAGWTSCLCLPANDHVQQRVSAWILCCTNRSVQIGANCLNNYCLSH